MRYTYDFDYITNTWHLGYTPNEAPNESWLSFPGRPPADQDWVLYGEVLSITTQDFVGLILTVVPLGGTEPENTGFMVSWTTSLSPGVYPSELGVVVVATANVELRIAFTAADKTLHYSYATTPGEWLDAGELVVEEVVDTGIILVWQGQMDPADGYITNIAEIPGTEDDGFEEFYADIPAWFAENPPPLADDEPTVYALIGAPFGDMEFDVGKSARWLEHFSDKLFALDVNLGNPRYWIINWTKTFPHSEHAVTSIDYFQKPVQFRKEQFAQADAVFHMPDDSWVIFVDGSEGLSFDNSSLPDDYDFNPFMSWVYREISRAYMVGEDRVVLPFFVFLASNEIQNVTYGDVTPGVPPVLQPVTVPYYLPYQGLLRMMQVSVLRDPAFDWKQIDQPQDPSPNVKAQIVSYAYAHWNLLNVPPDSSEPAGLSEENDDGYRMRKLISKVRPIPSLPANGTWDPAADPAGVPGPWAIYTTINTHANLVPVLDAPFTEPDAAVEGIKTPLYDCVFRLNMRDGVWYEGEASGNTPLVWNSLYQHWATPYDPAAWPDQGVESPPNPEFYYPPTPGPPALPVLTVLVNSSGMNVSCSINGAQEGEGFDISWGNPESSDAFVIAGPDGVAAASYTYPNPGTYIVNAWTSPGGMPIFPGQAVIAE